MSRVGKNAVEVPDGVQVELAGQLFKAKGKLGERSLRLADDVDVKIDGVQSSLSDRAAKPIKTFYNVGLGATAKYGMMEYGAAYDATIATKYIGHQGTLKLRVNF